MNRWIKTSLCALAAILTVAPTLPATARFLHHFDRNGIEHIDPILCLTDYQVRQVIARRGYSHILLNAPIESQIQVTANRDGVTYLIDFNRCANRIDGVRRANRQRG